jgi:hypothetical protein
MTCHLQVLRLTGCTHTIAWIHKHLKVHNVPSSVWSFHTPTWTPAGTVQEALARPVHTGWLKRRWFAVHTSQLSRGPCAATSGASWLQTSTSSKVQKPHLRTAVAMLTMGCTAQWAQLQMPCRLCPVC